LPKLYGIKYFHCLCIVPNQAVKIMTITKVEKKSQSITPFGGINFINEEFTRCGLSQIIDTKLGYRQSTKGFKHSDIVRAWFNIFICGGDVAENIQEHLRETLEVIPHNKVPK
jgi:hypothetical protein